MIASGEGVLRPGGACTEQCWFSSKQFDHRQPVNSMLLPWLAAPFIQALKVRSWTLGSLQTIVWQISLPCPKGAADLLGRRYTCCIMSRRLISRKKMPRLVAGYLRMQVYFFGSCLWATALHALELTNESGASTEIHEMRRFLLYAAETCRSSSSVPMTLIKHLAIGPVALESFWKSPNLSPHSAFEELRLYSLAGSSLENRL